MCSNTDIHLTSRRYTSATLSSNNLVLACRPLLQWLSLINLHTSGLPLSLHWLISNHNFSRHSRSSQVPPSIRFHIASDRRSCFLCWTDTLYHMLLTFQTVLNQSVSETSSSFPYISSYVDFLFWSIDEQHQFYYTILQSVTDMYHT